MSEPNAIATRVEQLRPGLWHWHLWDDRIAFASHAHAVADEAGGTVLIDPLPLAPEAMRLLEPIVAICLTAACHQRSAWRYRRAYGARVYAPQGTRPMEEEPDCRYQAGSSLPGGLQTIHTPGPETVHYAFWRERAPAVVFSPDLVMRTEAGDLQFIPPEYHDDPAATRRSVRRLLALPFAIFCMDHGAPLTDTPHQRLRTLLS